MKYMEGSGSIWSGGGNGGGLEVDGGAIKEALVGVADMAEGIVRQALADHEFDKPISKGRVNRETTVHSESPYVIGQFIHYCGAGRL